MSSGKRNRRESNRPRRGTGAATRGSGTPAETRSRGSATSAARKRRSAPKNKNIGQMLLFGLLTALVVVMTFFISMYGKLKTLITARVDAKLAKVILVSLAAALVLIGGGVGIHHALTVKNGLAIDLNGTRLGIIKVVKNKDVTGEYLADLAVKKLEQDVGARVQVQELVTMELIHAKKADFVTEDFIVNELRKNFTFLVEAARISVDGREMATVASEKDANAILDDIKNAFLQDGLEIQEVSFVEDVQTASVFVAYEDIVTMNRAAEILNTNLIEEKMYMIVDGDSLDKIAGKAGMTRAELLAINPGYTETSILRIGETMMLTVPRPLLSVQTKERVTYVEVVPKPVEIRENAGEHKSFSRILQQGKDGQQQVTADIVRVNGFEERREIVDTVELEAPITEIKEVGTSDSLPKRALGEFIMPATGRVTDYFHSRGGTHDGIDIASKKGTPIYASDGGVVITAGNSGDGYGSNVIIDHGNGFVTYYAHNSKILVTKGQAVAQGEQIALMGSTGNSTGNHCHFEIRKNGKPVNPFDYIR